MCEQEHDYADDHYAVGYDDGYATGLDIGYRNAQEHDDEIITSQFNELVRLQNIRENFNISLAVNLGQFALIVALLGIASIYLGY